MSIDNIDLSIKLFYCFCIALIALLVLFIFLISLKDKEKNKVKKVEVFPKHYLDFLQLSWWKETEKTLEQSNYTNGRYKELYVYGDDCVDDYD